MVLICCKEQIEGAAPAKPIHFSILLIFSHFKFGPHLFGYSDSRCKPNNCCLSWPAGSGISLRWTEDHKCYWQFGINPLFHFGLSCKCSFSNCCFSLRLACLISYLASPCHYTGSSSCLYEWIILIGSERVCKFCTFSFYHSYLKGYLLSN